MLVDMLILADSVQVADNKLYLLGGGWRYIRARSLPAAHQMGVGVGILVDWEETNERHDMRLELWHEDSHSMLMKIEGEFEQGRPPGIPAGSQQRVLMAFNSQVKLERDGPYRIRFFIDAKQFAETGFTVVNQSLQVQPGTNTGDASRP